MNKIFNLYKNLLHFLIIYYKIIKKSKIYYFNGLKKV